MNEIACHNIVLCPLAACLEQKKTAPLGRKRILIGLALNFIYAIHFSVFHAGSPFWELQTHYPSDFLSQSLIKSLSHLCLYVSVTLSLCLSITFSVFRYACLNAHAVFRSVLLENPNAVAPETIRTSNSSKPQDNLIIK